MQIREHDPNAALSRLVTVLFALTLFLSAALLFSAQPMIARMVLPELGGSPAVWTTCMLFFQAALLAAYFYAHVAARRASLRFQVAFQAGLLLAACAFVPLRVSTATSATLATRADPTGNLLALLARSVGLPFLVVATTAPLLQRWFSATRSDAARDPYFLYAASNAGSLAALLAYPLWVERVLGLEQQSVVWCRGFTALAALIAACGLCALLSPGRPERRATEAFDPPTAIKPVTWLGWVILAGIPSSLMLGVTAYITTDLASAPLFWVIPLALYLLSFVLVFARPQKAPGRFWPRALPIAVVPVALALAFGLASPFWLLIPLHLLAFFAAAMVCHGALARGRPHSSDLTAFYLAMAVGGAAGGLFNAVVAPLVFDRVVEYPLAIVAACLVLAFREGVRDETESGRTRLLPSALHLRDSAGASSSHLLASAPRSDLDFPRTALRIVVSDAVLPLVTGLLAAPVCANVFGLADRAIGALMTFAAAGFAFLAIVTHRKRPARFALTIGALLLASGLASGIAGRVIFRDRSFFGVLKVTTVDEAGERYHRLFHGSTLHGQQCMSPARRREPLTYFTRTGPIGDLFAAFEGRPDATRAKVAVTGVGAGSLASYARAEQEWTLYEIDPAVVRVARDPAYFTYLTDCQARVLKVQLGDARIELARAPEHGYDLVILDAFSSDAIPAHLLTREAVALYRRKTAEHGWLVFNITNRYLDLTPVVATLAADAGLVCRVRVDADVPTEERAAGKQGSIWAVMADETADLGPVATDPRWFTPRIIPEQAVWTDDFSNLLQHLRFRSMGGRGSGPGTNKP